MTADDATIKLIKCLDSYFSFLKPLLEEFKFIYVLKLSNSWKCKFAYDVSKGIPLNINGYYFFMYNNILIGWSEGSFGDVYEYVQKIHKDKVGLYNIYAIYVNMWDNS